MTTATIQLHPRVGVLRHSKWDALLVGLAVAHGVMLAMFPVWPVIAIGIWWNSNTIAHNFIHKPFFRAKTLNVAFSLYQSVLLGIPQTIWRARHLAHHADAPCRVTLSWLTCAEISLVVGLWAALAMWSPAFFAFAYLPGYVAGLVLCHLQGHYEHADGTISHYGRAYNFLFFNDGYHVEHHAHAGVHWRELPKHAKARARASAYPAVLRWMDRGCVKERDGAVNRLLHWLERRVLRSPELQRFVLRRHERAIARLLREIDDVRRVGIVGGALFPRTALVMQRLVPEAEVTVIDGSVANVRVAREYLAGVDFVNEWFDPARHADFDLLVFPLSYVGDHRQLYGAPPARNVMVHDWIWRRRRGTVGAVVSPWLLKRINLVRR